jgi:hypothetical protein
MRLLVPVVQQSKTERRVATKLNTPTSPVTKCPHRVLKQAEWSRTPSCAQDERPPWIGVKHDHLVAQDERPLAHGVKLFDLVPQAKGPPLLGFKQSQGDLLPPTHSVKLFDLVPQAKGPPHLGVKQLQRASLPPRPQTSPSTKRPNESSPEPTTRNRKQRTVTAPCGLDPSAPNLRTRACAERNATRFEQASREDTKTTGENQGQPLAPNPWRPALRHLSLNQFLDLTTLSPDKIGSSRTYKILPRCHAQSRGSQTSSSTSQLKQLSTTPTSFANTTMTLQNCWRHSMAQHWILNPSSGQPRSSSPCWVST